MMLLLTQREGGPNQSPLRKPTLPREDPSRPGEATIRTRGLLLSRFARRGRGATRPGRGPAWARSPWARYHRYARLGQTAGSGGSGGSGGIGPRLRSGELRLAFLEAAEQAFLDLVDLRAASPERFFGPFQVAAAAGTLLLSGAERPLLFL